MCASGFQRPSFEDRGCVVAVVNWEAKPNDERDLRAVFVIGEVVAGIEVKARASRGVLLLLLTILALGQSAHA